MELPTPLETPLLRRRCDPNLLGFATTKDLEPSDGLIGQSRALEALRFGTELNAGGYNIFVLGTPGTGRHNAVFQFLDRCADERHPTDDWVYVYNFEEAHRPRALRLPSGSARRFAADMDTLIDSLKTSMPAVFESEDYQTRRKSIEEAFRGAQELAFTEVSNKAEQQDLRLLRTPQGLAIAPLRDGEVIDPAAFEKLPEEERKETQDRISSLQSELREAMEQVPVLDKDRREKIRKLNRDLAEVAVGRAMMDLVNTFRRDESIASEDREEIFAHLKEVRSDLIENAHLFVQSADQLDTPQAELTPELPLDLRFNRYRVNVIVCHQKADESDEKCLPNAPVVYEDYPGLGHLVGRIEHVPHMGAMLTDFTLIKAGALHRANGGYLVMDAERLISMPYAWHALKRSIRSRAVAIEPPMTGSQTVTAVTLEPEPIPLDAKIILIGERQTFYLLSQLDPDFRDLFKVAVDFDEIIERDSQSTQEFCRLIAGIADKEGMKALTAGGCAAMVEHASRLASDGERLTLRVSILADIVREADYLAGRAGREVVEDEDIKRAIDAQVRRLDRVRDQSHEQITRDTVLIDVEGAAVGQINGLSVLQIGAFAFGKPTRISARTSVGDGRLIDIEREVELGGPLHSKGVLILSGFLASRYAQDMPISLAASLVFEQSYGGVDGDSASSTELYALLSALSGVPISQGLAVTGSVNQYGDVQAIGGVNEKIEGFFDICSAKGLDGKQGVLVPHSNVKHLMLREDVVRACAEGHFRVFGVSHIDQGIEILTGVSAGERNSEGFYPEGTINRRVEDKLRSYAQVRQDFFAGNGFGKTEV